MNHVATEPKRSLGLTGAVGVGVGSMLGAGVFVVWGPAAARAGSSLLVAVLIAAVVATINAISTAHLAAKYPVAGGAYAYGRRELGGPWGFIAGVGFVVGKMASVGAMGLAIGGVLWPAHAPVVATVVIAAAWALNAGGVKRTAGATTIGAALVVAGLVAICIASLGEPAAAQGAAQVVVGSGGIGGVASGAALMFFAFAGYARLATLGEEVRNPAKTIPAAIAISLAVVAVLYVALVLVVSRRPGLEALGESSAPLLEAAPTGGSWGAVIAALTVLAVGGALIALTAGLGRTAMAMAREGDLPRMLATVNSRSVPWLAEAIAAAGGIALAWWGNLGFALAMSSAAVLTYYAVANAAAAHSWKSLPMRAVAVLGLALCAALVASVDPWASATALGALVALAALRWLLGRRGRPAAT